MSQPPTCPPGTHLVTTYTCVPDTQPCPDLPADGRPQPMKNANKDANTWKVVPMKDDPALFKIVDDKNVNVADQFHTQAAADQYVAHYKCVDEPDPEPCPAGQHRDASGNCVPDTPPPGGQLGPYASTGKELGATTRRAVRHYASGKPDDQTIEKNTKSIPYQNYQCVYYVTMHKIEHDDNVSSKLGGTHMGTGWFDHGVSFQNGKCCLGNEPDHPSTNSCIKVGASIGSIIEKRTGVATVYRKATNYTELWTNTGSGWVKQLDATDLGGFNPNNSGNDEAQLRIDGFEDGSDPTIDVAVVQEIAA